MLRYLELIKRALECRGKCIVGRKSVCKYTDLIVNMNKALVTFML